MSLLARVAWVCFMLGALSGPMHASARPAPDSFRDVVRTLSPAVVNISTTQAVTGGALARPEAPKGTPLADLMGHQREKLTGGSANDGVQSLGSGFLVDPSGLIVTNQHVVARASAIMVTLFDGRRMAAALIGSDPRTDLALLKVNAQAPLPFARFGDSDKTEVGDWVVVIGNPYGLGGSVSAGIVSARNRELNLGSYDDFIQTDAAINSGNSGGPLFNMDGDVVGINSALLSPSGGSVGIGFAISSNLARPIIAQLRSFGAARRGWIGVRVQSITPDLAEALGLPAIKGALISNVTRDGPAAKAGLKAGDVILKFDGKDISDMRGFPRIVAETPVNQICVAEILRGNTAMTISVTVSRLDEMPAMPRPVLVASASEQSSHAIGFGAKLSVLDASNRTRLGVAPSVEGVVVEEISTGSLAAENDVRIGDIITEAGRAPVRLERDLAAHLSVARQMGRRVLLLGVSRRGEFSYKAFRLAPN